MEDVDQYVQAGILLPSEGGVEWAGAGTCPGAVIRRTGVFQEFATHGPPLGMMDGFLYGTEKMELGAGDSVLVLSDVPKGVFRGAADLVSSLQGKPAGDIVSKLHRALAKAQPDSNLEASVILVRRQ
jgi:serine phosphatase RsbU (regulator of sigma subunit)